MLTGGVRTPSDALVGPIAVNAIRSLHLDVLFLGVHGITADAGLTTPNLLEAETDRALVAASERLVVVADHVKWGVRGLSRIAGLEDVDVFVSDPGLPREARATIKEHVDRLVIAPKGPARPPARCRVSDLDRGDLRRDELTGILTYRRRLAAGRGRTCPRPPARSAPAGSRRPSRTTCAGSRTAGPRCPDERCEVVLYTPEHDATFWSLGAAGARKVIDLWAERSAALGARPDVDYVLVFENRGAEVGATIVHPHGQIYAFDFVPELPRRELERGDAARRAGRPPRRTGRRLAGVGARRRRSSRTRSGSRPTSRCPTCRRSTSAGRDALAALLVDVLERLDRLFDAETPYMLWIHQRPFDGGDWPDAQLHVEIVSPWRAAGRHPLRRGRRARLRASTSTRSRPRPRPRRCATRSCRRRTSGARGAALPRRRGAAGCCRSSRA